MKTIVGYIGAAIALLGVLFNAGTRWGEMNLKLETALQRLDKLEAEGRFMHGDLKLPRGAK